jgi:hypothetical protein
LVGYGIHRPRKEAKEAPRGINENNKIAKGIIGKDTSFSR